MDIVAIDILSGLPSIKDSSKYILVATDYFTKWSEAYALPDAEVSTCMRVLYDRFFSRFGLPCQLHSDMGRNFESNLFRERCELVGVQKSHTTSFCPKSDGQTERINRSLLQMLRATAQEHPENWLQRLPTLMSAYRMTIHKTTGMTPNFAMLACKVQLPASLIAKPPKEPMESKVPFMKNFRETMRDAHIRMRNATQWSAKTQKTYYDRMSKRIKFAKRQLVWPYWPKPVVRQRFRKLWQPWTGPWQIQAFKSTVVVCIRKTFGNKTRQTVNVDRLLPCSKPPPSNGSPHGMDNIPLESTPVNEGLDSQETQDFSENCFDSMSMTESQCPVCKRRLPRSLEDYIL